MNVKNYEYVWLQLVEDVWVNCSDELNSNLECLYISEINENKEIDICDNLNNTYNIKYNINKLTLEDNKIYTLSFNNIYSIIPAAHCDNTGLHIFQYFKRIKIKKNVIINFDEKEVLDKKKKVKLKLGIVRLI